LYRIISILFEIVSENAIGKVCCVHIEIQEIFACQLFGGGSLKECAFEKKATWHLAL
jgi:hypothetical protein